MQKIRFKNNCGCIVDEELLSIAIHRAFPDFRKKKSQKRSITVYGTRRQPAIAMNNRQYPVSRLIAQFLWPKMMKATNVVVHHKNARPLDNRRDNLEILSQGKHSKHHLIGRRCSPDNSDKNEVISLYQHGYTLEEIADIYECNFGTIYNRLKQWNIPRRPRGTRGTK